MSGEQERAHVVAFLRMRNGDLTEEEATVLELYAQAIEDGDHLKVPGAREATDVLNSCVQPANVSPAERLRVTYYGGQITAAEYITGLRADAGEEVDENDGPHTDTPF